MSSPSNSNSYLNLGTAIPLGSTSSQLVALVNADEGSQNPDPNSPTFQFNFRTDGNLYLEELNQDGSVAATVWSMNPCPSLSLYPEGVPSTAVAYLGWHTPATDAESDGWYVWSDASFSIYLCLNGLIDQTTRPEDVQPKIVYAQTTDLGAGNANWLTDGNSYFYIDATKGNQPWVIMSRHLDSDMWSAIPHSSPPPLPAKIDTWDEAIGVAQLIQIGGASAGAGMDVLKAYQAQNMNSLSTNQNAALNFIVVPWNAYLANPNPQTMIPFIEQIPGAIMQMQTATPSSKAA